MTDELRRARAHLKYCQNHLKYARDVSVYEKGQWWPDCMMSNAEEGVIAALSWVWDAQQRDAILRFENLTYYFNVPNFASNSNVRTLTTIRQSYLDRIRKEYEA